MKEPNHNINDLFAVARNAEVKISLDDVRTNLSKNVAKTSMINWRMIIFSITGVLLLVSLPFLSIKPINSELSMDNHSNQVTAKTSPVTKKIAPLKNEELIKNNNENTLPIISSQEKKTEPKVIEIDRETIENKIQKKELDLVPIKRIVFQSTLKNKTASKEIISPILSFAEHPKNPLPIIEMPEFKINTLPDKILEKGKGEIHYMETLKSKETISLKSYKKRGKKHLKLDRYNENFELIKSIDLSNIIQENKRDLHNVKVFNNQLLLVTSEVSKKEKSRSYIGHKIDYNTMKEKGNSLLGTFPLSQTKKGINLQESSNGKYLLVNVKPESTKNQKKKLQKGINDRVIFQVYDENLKPFYSIKKDGFLAYGTAIDDLGRIYVWKAQPKFLTSSRSSESLKDGNILYQFGINNTDSLILKEDSFLGTVSRKAAKLRSSNEDSTASQKRPSISYNHRLIELKGLELTLSPEGNPILYGYLKNMRGLQQLTFTTDSLSPYHYSVLDFQTKSELEAEKARENGEPELILNVDEVFFDEASNFYVLSSSYKRSYLPLVAQEKHSKSKDFSEKIPVPYYPSFDIYVHKFNQEGIPIMNTKIASSAIGRNQESDNYSYLFNDQNFSVVYLEHIVRKKTEHTPSLGRDKKQNNGDELTIASTKQDGEIIQFRVNNEYEINIADYIPVKYFRNKGETLVLLKAGNSYKISKLSYRNRSEKFENW